MELTDLRSLMTVLSFVAFLAVFAWAWTARRRSAFDEAAQLPFDGDNDDLPTVPVVPADPVAPVDPVAQRALRRAPGAPQ